jgi:hypothetical protein
MHVYSESDAVAFILAWQFVALLFSGLLSCLAESHIAGWRLGVPMGVGFSLSCLTGLVLLDMLLLPPAFALVRFAYALM